MNPSYAKPFIFAATIIFLAVVVFLRFFAGSRTAITEAVLPFERGSRLISGSTSTDDLLARSKVDLANEIIELREKVQKYQSSYRAVRRLATENKQLRETLKAPIPKGYRRITAQVTMRDPAKGGRIFRINRGSNDGLIPGLAVLSGNCLIGRIQDTDQTKSSVTKNSSTVITIIDPNCKVPARILGTKAYGILFGGGEEGWKNNPYSLLKHLPRDMDYKEGAEVVTSLYSQYMPPDLSIGTLRPRHDGSLVREVDKLYKNVWVKPLGMQQDFSVVTILLPEEKEEASSPAQPHSSKGSINN